MVTPTFVKPEQLESRLRIMLSFSVAGSANISQWCTGLSSILEAMDVKAAIFFAGRVADEHRQCVTLFSNSVDIGSQTYNYVDLAPISNYTLQLEEVKNGKYAVDFAGHLYSKLFKAPFGSTDESIYSLLDQSGIIADFSYQDHYNIFVKDKFLRFDCKSYDGSEYPAEFFTSIQREKSPILLNFNNTTPISYINDFVSKLKAASIQFVNASELAEQNLTLRG
jgi:peptidoglycan/xylan/chitin deacetylase (PgdA/CDA1 family)